MSKITFNRAATSYDASCSLQQAVGMTLIQYASQFANPTSIIDLGCGTGLVTEQVLQTFKPGNIHAIDNAENLLMLAKQRLANQAEVYSADFNDLKSSHSFDLAFSNLALHWSNDLKTTLQCIHSSLNANGYLAFSIPTQGTFIEFEHHLSRLEFNSEELITQLLETQNFTIAKKLTEKITLPFPSTLTALRSIKQVGANYVPTRLKKGLQGKNLLRTLNLQQLTYNISYFIAKKTTP